MSRKTRTPKWVSITRKLYTYIGGSGMFAVISGKYGISDSDMLFIVELYLMGQFAIQVICDSYFLKEDSAPAFKPEKTDIKP